LDSILIEYQLYNRGIIIASDDITQLGAAQGLLSQSANGLKSIMESLPLAIYVSTDEDQVCEYLNETFTEMFGYTLGDVPSVAEWYPKAYPDKDYRESIVSTWQDRIQTAIALKTHIEPIECVVTCKDGTTKYVRWGYISLDELNYAFALDITAIKEAEDELKLEAKLNEEREKRIIYTATVRSTQHILNNMLNGMQLFKMKAQKADIFDDETKAQFEYTISQGTELVKKLSAVEVLTESNIRASVYPKSDK
jgi:PAS domain S-box-containing protein